MEAQTYYESLVAQGYSAEQAQQYTAQHYPGFGVAPTPTAPMQPAAPVATGGSAPAAAAAPVQPIVQPVVQMAPVQPVVQQQQVYQPQSQITTSPVVITTQPASENTSWIVPWVGIVVIFVAMSMPFIDLGDGTVEVSGYELLEIYADLIEEYDPESSDNSDGGGDADVPLEVKCFAIAIMMLALSPLFFGFTGIVSALMLLTKNHPSSIGGLHLFFLIAFVVISIIGTIDTGFLFGGDVSVHEDIAGIGFFLAGGAGIALCIKA